MDEPRPDRIEEPLAEYLDGSLSREERDAVSARLRASEEARKQAEQAREDARFASAIFKAAPKRPSRDLRRRVLEAIPEGHGVILSTRLETRRFHWVPSAIVVAAAVVLFYLPLLPEPRATVRSFSEVQTAVWVLCLGSLLLGAIAFVAAFPLARIEARLLSRLQIGKAYVSTIDVLLLRVVGFFLMVFACGSSFEILPLFQ